MSDLFPSTVCITLGFIAFKLIGEYYTHRRDMAIIALFDKTIDKIFNIKVIKNM